MIKVFLGGTCNEDNWRQKLIPLLSKNIEWYDPVVPDWNEEAQRKEKEFKANSNYNVYVITPAMTGVFSIAEVVDDSNKKPEKTIFCIRNYSERGDKGVVFTPGQLKSLCAVADMIRDNGAIVCNTLESLAERLNQLTD